MRDLDYKFLNPKFISDFNNEEPQNLKKKLELLSFYEEDY